MNLTSVTLLEVCQVAHGRQVACCLSTGEYLFVTKESPQVFECGKPCELFGRNLCEFLVPYDVEKLQDYLRAQSRGGVVSNDVATRLTMMVRLVQTGKTLWIRIKTVPLSMRLMRCIDSVLYSRPLCHRFSDISSFVITEDDLASIGSEPAEASAVVGSETGIEDSNKWRRRSSYHAPLELKNAEIAMSPVSPSGILPTMDECSLSSFAFEADWEREVYLGGTTHLGGSVAGNTLRM